jgi:hypothetical protein
MRRERGGISGLEKMKTGFFDKIEEYEGKCRVLMLVIEIYQWLGGFLVWMFLC